jgi:raffinose/stachyose/melibiose transport system substrate-binding protein
MIMKKLTYLVLMLTLTLCMLGGCTRQSTGNKQIKLTLWSIWSSDSESNKAPFLKTLEEFRAAYPHITVELDMNEAEAYRTKLRTAVAANEAPDVFYHNAGGLLKPFVEAGKVLALNGYLDKGGWDRLVEGTLINMTFDGKVYGLPYTLATSVLFCNKDLFNKYNVELPKTWDELMTAVKTFRDAGITPMTTGGKDRWPTSMYFDIIMLRTAGYRECYETYNKTARGSFVSKGMRLGAEKFAELLDAGAFPAGAVALTRDESEVPFYAGEVAMYVNGNWTAANCEADSSAVKGKIVAIPFPTIEGGAGSINDFMGGAAEQFCVSANTKHKDAAVLLCQFIAENHSKNAYLAGAGMPTWKFNIDTSQIDPLVASIVALTNNATSFLLWGNTILEGEDSEMLMDIHQEMLMGDLTPSEFCEKLQANIYK